MVADPGTQHGNHWILGECMVDPGTQHGNHWILGECMVADPGTQHGNHWILVECMVDPGTQHGNHWILVECMVYPGTQHGNHWILVECMVDPGDVSALVGSPPFNDASQHQVYPGSNVLALPPLYTTPLIRAEKLAKQLQGLGPGSACSSSSVLLAPAPGSRLDEAYSVAKSLTESSHSHMSEMQANGREVGQLLGQWCSRNAASTPGVAAVSSAMVDQERVVVSITALMLLGLQAMTERSERQLPAADTPALNIQQEQSSVSSLISVALWLRLSILLPLLPIIHADRDPDSRGNLRNLLVPALVHLLLAPHIRPLAPVGSALALQQGRLFKVPSSLSRQKPSWETLCLKYPDVAAALQAQDAAGESLQDRLSAILAALLSGGWASWLRGRQNKRLRDVAAFEGSKALQENLDRLLQQQQQQAGSAFNLQDSEGTAVQQQQQLPAWRVNGSAAAAPAESSLAIYLTPGVRLRLQGALPPTHLQMSFKTASCKTKPAPQGESQETLVSLSGSTPSKSNIVLSAWTPLPLESLQFSHNSAGSGVGLVKPQEGVAGSSSGSSQNSAATGLGRSSSSSRSAGSLQELGWGACCQVAACSSCAWILGGLVPANV
ncbi:hypothetical protein CEUSTIGMA_g7732.t1 [Chlamydomonas eustigma]|uniref:Uncharacterized protein n=1 Tax=Chlamydomonas eustigma TaxID=1157962 RepID=A0A250XB57_9CHLO|nr:hypothetical protein CEUSTIGMA_g7732.t1 [Chlamydomonas eustigma]|eukprot:GAX80294.1 hypothetical protein CEUSTIGMA_g7732.t1 [Chlamydomonas eustigma]